MNLAVDPRAVESLLAFWADAGVEASYADDPIDRLAEGAALLRARKEPAAPVAIAPVSTPGFGRGPDLGAAVAEARPWPPPAPTCPPWPPPSPPSTAARSRPRARARPWSRAARPTRR
jgi:hypothetical protein